MTATVTSRDGTSLAYDRRGDGPAVVLVSAALNLRGSGTGLATSLAARGFTTIAYDRRARGESGDAAPLAEWDPRREVEDLEAILGLVGGRAAVFGWSSGAQLCLYAATAGLDVTHLALFEIPLPQEPDDGGAEQRELRRLVVAGDHGGAVERYMKDMPREWLEGAKAGPYWAAMTAMAPSLGYDLAVVNWSQSAPPEQLFGGIRQPTLVMSGENPLPLFTAAAETLERTMPAARARTVKGANHGWDDAAMTEALVELVNPTRTSTR
ncbi:MAG TPA: alpha/beta fold hydrolase [Lapillicoccus sp.]|nr:alpha/beta fold hydrolase [Lapillicoccus sp.]